MHGGHVMKLNHGTALEWCWKNWWVIDKLEEKTTLPSLPKERWEKREISNRSINVQYVYKSSKTEIANGKRTHATNFRSLSKRIYDRSKCVPMHGAGDKGILVYSSVMIYACIALSVTVPFSRFSCNHLDTMEARFHAKVLSEILSRPSNLGEMH